MGDKFLNNTGLTYFYNRIKTLFASQSDLDTLEGRVDDIVAEGGEPNVITKVQKNGTDLPINNKTVNVIVPTAVTDLSDAADYAKHTDLPTKTSDLTNDGDGTSNFATENYVTVNGGKIDKIKVNNVEQTITNKEVNITMPTKVSDLTNDGDGTTDSRFATESYVDTNGGKIDVIKVNGTAQTITNKAVDITVPTTVAQLTDESNYAKQTDLPTALSELTNDADFLTETQIDTKISTAVASVYKYKGSVATVADLPASGNTTGDVYDVQATGVNYAWDGTRWDELGSYVDTSLLWQKSELVAITTSEIDTIIDGQ